jgi:hypothetical protein
MVATTATTSRPTSHGSADRRRGIGPSSYDVLGVGAAAGCGAGAGVVGAAGGAAGGATASAKRG